MQMPGELVPSLKEILYRCLEEIRATKAALFLLDDDGFVLASEYGFRDKIRKHIPASDDLVDRLLTKRSAYIINGLNDDQRFSQLLFDSETSRMLIAPIYSRGKLVGFLDLRDKAGKLLFETADITNSQKIVDQFLDLFAQKNLYGQQPLPVAPPSPAEAPQEGLRATDMIVNDARRAIERGVLRPEAPRSLTESEIDAASAMLPAFLGLRGALLVGLSVFSKTGGAQTLASRSEITQPVIDYFDARIRAWQRKRGEQEQSGRISVVYPFGISPEVLVPARINSLLSAPLQVAGTGGIVLSIGFEMAPDAGVRAILERFHHQLQQLLEATVAQDKLLAMYERVAERLLEPDLLRLPHLADHSRRVAELSERLARHIGLAPAEVQKIRLAALVHDVGMRLLDYQALYRKTTLTNDDKKLMKDHPSVGAVVVGQSPLGREIGGIVFAHHERPDGTGYPRGLAGDEIPVASRIIHIGEAFDAMTSQDSYQNPVAPQAALAKMRRLAGAQFDAELTARFAEIIGV